MIRDTLLKKSNFNKNTYEVRNFIKRHQIISPFIFAIITNFFDTKNTRVRNSMMMRNIEIKCVDGYPYEKKVYKKIIINLFSLKNLIFSQVSFFSPQTPYDTNIEYVHVIHVIVINGSDNDKQFKVITIFFVKKSANFEGANRLVLFSSSICGTCIRH